MDAAQGFSAQGAGAAVILASTHFGFPLSTTHVINGGVMGAGRRQAALGGALGRGRQHRHRLAADPAGGGGDRRRSPTAFTAIFGDGALGPVLVTLMALSLIAAPSSAATARGRRFRRASRWPEH